MIRREMSAFSQTKEIPKAPTEVNHITASVISVQ